VVVLTFYVDCGLEFVLTVSNSMAASTSDTAFSSGTELGQMTKALTVVTLLQLDLEIWPLIRHSFQKKLAVFKFLEDVLSCDDSRKSLHCQFDRRRIDFPKLNVTCTSMPSANQK
ncbi:hypothetical protein L9F63_003037, partial [Diploptera punctata]